MPVKIIQLFSTYPLFFQPYIPPVVNLLREQPDLDLQVLHYEGVGNEYSIKMPSSGSKSIRTKLQKLLYGKETDYLGQYLSESGIQVLHLMDSFLFDKIVPLFDLPKEFRPKIVMTMRGKDTYVKPLVFDKWKDFYKKYAKSIDCFIAMSEHQKYRLIQLGVDSQKIHVIPISLSSSFQTIHKELDTSCIRIVSVFRFVWEKNLEGNLRVIKCLKERGFCVRYDLYGDGHMLSSVLFLIDKYNIEDCVFIHGKISNELLLTTLTKSDFYLQLSHSESLGMSVIEAQSQGLPAIIANSGGLPETILKGKSGYCLNPWDAEAAADHIINLWKYPNLYKEFSKASIANCSVCFSNKIEVQRITNLYKRLVL